MEPKIKTYYVFVALVYKNTDDLEKFLGQIRDLNINYRVIVVDAFFSDDVSLKVKRISSCFEADYIAIENKGYSFGNNSGIKYAVDHYEFEYLIVCNTDIVIEKLPANLPDTFSQMVVAPIIRTMNNKMQNPYWACFNNVAEYLIYLGSKKDHLLYIYSGIVLYKIQRNISVALFMLSRKSERRIASPHGSFIVFSKFSIEQLRQPFDDNMFLFAEESLLAHTLRINRLDCILTKRIQIQHMEDGSMGASKVNQHDVSCQSVIYYYEKIHDGNEKARDMK